MDDYKPIADYYLCDNCGDKVFVDTQVDYSKVGGIAVICFDCAQDHTIAVCDTKTIDALTRHEMMLGFASRGGRRAGEMDVDN